MLDSPPAERMSLAALYDAIETAIATRHAGGLDLSVPGRVLRGTYALPPGELPAVAIEPPALDSEPEARERWHVRQLVWTIRAWVPYPQEMDAARAAAGVVALDALVSALERARSDRSSVLRACAAWRITGAELPPVLAADVPVAAAVRITLSTAYRRHYGV